LVKADVEKRRIDILVDGPVNRRRTALGIISDRVRTIHARNPEAEPNPLVPLPDQPDMTRLMSIF
jgi:hypothetical protein